MDTSTESEWVTRSQHGDKAAFGVLIDATQTWVLALSRARVGDRAAAQDVAQETFVAAWRALPSLRDPTRFRGFLAGIVRNVAHAGVVTGNRGAFDIELRSSAPMLALAIDPLRGWSEPVALTGASQENVRLVLTPTASLHVQIRKDEEPVESGTIFVRRRFDGERWFGTHARTSERGVFALTPLPPGSYEVQACPADLFDHAASACDTQTVTVVAGAPATV